MLELIQTIQEWLRVSIGDYSCTMAVINLSLTVFIILIYWLVYALVFRGFRAFSRHVLKEDSDVQPLRIQKQEILSAAEVAAIMSGKVINYSTQARKAGIMLHTGITIGYDVPWPKVQELLLSAASATEHIDEKPAPFVLQTALDDNYVAYELNASTRRADLRPKIYSSLHAHILDAFHTAGVEITSPHYRAVRDGNDPAMASVIPQPSADPA